MTAQITSVELIASAIETYDRFARQQARHVDDPEIGMGQAYECGRRSLGARAHALAWTIPGPVRHRVEELESELVAASQEEALEWLERFPHEVLGALERRSSMAGRPDGPRHRFVDAARRG
jgi:hypothetical protein